MEAKACTKYSLYSVIARLDINNVLQLSYSRQFIFSIFSNLKHLRGRPHQWVKKLTQNELGKCFQCLNTKITHTLTRPAVENLAFSLACQPFGTPSPMNAFHKITISQHSRVAEGTFNPLRSVHGVLYNMPSQRACGFCT